jgi:TM2 domain-containing membrane protein YozV
MSAGEIKTCSQCGAPIDARASSCKFCGAEYAKAPVYTAPPQRTPPPQAGPYAGSYQQPPPGGPYQGPYQGQYQPPQGPYYPPPVQQPSYSGKSKVVAGILGIFLGGLGIHKFYLGRTGAGVVYLLFCWTGIPAIIGFIEGIIYLCTNDQAFEAKYPRHY